MLKTITGSDGTNPLGDGALRGMIAGALVGVLGFINNKSDWLTDQDVVVLGPVVVFLAFFLAGAWDRYIRPRL